MTTQTSSWINKIARAGLVSKGIVYLQLGVLAFMAAFGINGQSGESASKSGVFDLVKDLPAGFVLLLVITAGLLCYAAWRFIQAYHTRSQETEKKWGKKIRYAFSGVAYLLLAVSAFQLLMYNKQSDGDQNQYWAAEIMSKPLGQWLLGIGALFMAAIGGYQIWYGFSEKYKKHVDDQGFDSGISSTILISGKAGYTARGMVWLIIAWMLLKAAMNANPKEAGDTSRAFEFLEQGSTGPILLGALGLGLAAYGVFNFIRAAYERFDKT